MTQFAQAIVSGLGQGSIYALVALGFVIIYKSTRVISFAQPALMITGSLFVAFLHDVIHQPQLRQSKDLPDMSQKLRTLHEVAPIPVPTSLPQKYICGAKMRFALVTVHVG